MFYGLVFVLIRVPVKQRAIIRGAKEKQRFFLVWTHFQNPLAINEQAITVLKRMARVQMVWKQMSDPL